MRRTMARAAAAAVATAAMTTGVVAATASPASAAPCGYYWTGGINGTVDYYNHCGNRHAEVYVYMRFGGSGWHCLPPGITNLVRHTGRQSSDIYYARSYGDPCW